MKNVVKIKFYAYLILLIIIMIGVLELLIKQTDYEKMIYEYCKANLDMNFSGKVYETYFDFFNKGAFVFKIKNSNNEVKEIYLYKKDPNPSNYIQMGDSIVKYKGKTILYIYKKGNKDSLIVFNYSCLE